MTWSHILFCSATIKNIFKKWSIINTRQKMELHTNKRNHFDWLNDWLILSLAVQWRPSLWGSAPLPVCLQLSADVRRLSVRRLCKPFDHWSIQELQPINHWSVLTPLSPWLCAGGEPHRVLPGSNTSRSGHLQEQRAGGKISVVG